MCDEVVIEEEIDREFPKIIEKMFEQLQNMVKNEKLSEMSKSSDLTELWDCKHKSLLHVAVKYRGYDVVSWLLDSNGFGSALVRETFHDVIHTIILSISMFENMNDDQFEEKCSVLQLILLIRPELVNTRDSFQRTPLHVAVAWQFKNSRQLQLIHILLQNNADVNAVDHVRKTPLHKAVERIPFNNDFIHILKIFVSHNADLLAVDQLRRGFIHLAASNATPHIFHQIIHYLEFIKRTDCFGTVDLYGASLLHYAVKHIDLRYKTILVFKKYNVNFHARDDYGKSVLNTAIQYQKSLLLIQLFRRCGYQM
ncbi:unnamed protein product [Orchesella dallaii]|uniref:Uncharacterized protein n=1 Tax=Orchesella dallaii TaxID=48710 RepID=A0ABP1Q6Q0_9HEXA